MTTDRLRVDDCVEIKSREEILASLDANGCLDGLPFMPEMLRFCGTRLRVSAVAHKTCDTVWQTGGRRIKSTVHLGEARCDGSAHGGCQAACLLFWKTAWIKRAADTTDAGTSGQSLAGTGDSELSRTVFAPDSTQERPIYVCQATRLHAFTQPLAWWDIRQYWADYRSGNANLRKAVSVLTLAFLFHLRKLPFGYRLNCWIYDRAHRMLRGTRDPYRDGRIPLGQPTPDERQNLTAGEWVEVKSHDAILETITTNRRNRGLSFDPEMVRFCGGRFRVAGRVTRIINERTGEPMQFSNPCIILDKVACHAEYSHRRLLCPRRITPYWREIWLTRVGGLTQSAPRQPDDAANAAAQRGVGR